MARDTAEQGPGHQVAQPGGGRFLLGRLSTEPQDQAALLGGRAWGRLTHSHPGLTQLKERAQAHGRLTEAVLGADVEVFALHRIAAAVRARLDAGGAGREVPGDSYDTEGGHLRGEATGARSGPARVS